MFGASAPDTGWHMECLAAYGTEEQKQRWLVPLLQPGHTCSRRTR